MWLVDTVFSRIDVIVGVWVRGEGLRIYNLIREAAADDKGILWL